LIPIVPRYRGFQNANRRRRETETRGHMDHSEVPPSASPVPGDGCSGQRTAAAAEELQRPVPRARAGGRRSQPRRYPRPARAASSTSPKAPPSRWRRH